jgi:hypothetical protein
MRSAETAKPHDGQTRFGISDSGVLRRRAENCRAYRNCQGEAVGAGTRTPGWGWLPPVPPPEPALTLGPPVGVSSPVPLPPAPLLPLAPLPPVPPLLDDAAAEPPLPPAGPAPPPSELATEQLTALLAQSATPIWMLALV